MVSTCNSTSTSCTGHATVKVQVQYRTFFTITTLLSSKLESSGLYVERSIEYRRRPKNIFSLSENSCPSVGNHCNNKLSSLRDNSTISNCGYRRVPIEKKNNRTHNNGLNNKKYFSTKKNICALLFQKPNRITLLTRKRYEILFIRIVNSTREHKLEYL